MEKDKMVEKVCEKMCAVYYDDDGTCSLDGVLCRDDKQCVRRQNAKDLIDELFPEGAVVLTKEEIKSGITYYDVVKDIIRKETAKEILDDIFSDTYSIGGGLYELTSKNKKMLYKKFGVEVE
jgi:hypothetical protein